jgi:hypothetical protein
LHTSCDSRTAIVFVSEGSERVETATLSFKPNHYLQINSPLQIPCPMHVACIWTGTGQTNPDTSFGLVKRSAGSLRRLPWGGSSSRPGPHAPGHARTPARSTPARPRAPPRGRDDSHFFYRNGLHDFTVHVHGMRVASARGLAMRYPRTPTARVGAVGHAPANDPRAGF